MASENGLQIEIHKRTKEIRDLHYHALPHVSQLIQHTVSPLIYIFMTMAFVSKAFLSLGIVGGFALQNRWRSAIESHKTVSLKIYFQTLSPKYFNSNYICRINYLYVPYYLQRLSYRRRRVLQLREVFSTQPPP